MRFLVIIISTTMLMACSSIPLMGQATIVHVEVPVSCVDKDFPQRQVYTDTAEALKNAKEGPIRYSLLAGNWFPRDARIEALEKQVDLCRIVSLSH